jgi:hypothetical protein
MPRFLNFARTLCVLSILCLASPAFGQTSKRRVMIDDPIVEGEATRVQIANVLDALESAIGKQKKYTAVSHTSQSFQADLSRAKTEQLSGMIDEKQWKQMGKIGSGDYVCKTYITADSTSFVVKYTLHETQVQELVKSVSKDLGRQKGDLKKACEGLAKSLFK